MPDTFQTRYGKQHLKEWQARHMKTVELLEVFNTSRGKKLVVKSEDEIRKGDVIEVSGNAYKVMGIMFPTRPCNDGRFAIVVSPIVE